MWWSEQIECGDAKTRRGDGARWVSRGGVGAQHGGGSAVESESRSGGGSGNRRCSGDAKRSRGKPGASYTVERPSTAPYNLARLPMASEERRAAVQPCVEPEVGRRPCM